MSYWDDNTPKSRGNAFDIPAIAQPETKQQRHNRLHREAAARRKLAGMMKPKRSITILNQADADKTARINRGNKP